MKFFRKTSVAVLLTALVVVLCCVCFLVALWIIMILVRFVVG